MNFIKGTNFRQKIFFAIVMVNFLFIMAMAVFHLYKDMVWLKSTKKQNLTKIENKAQQVLERISREQKGQKEEEQRVSYQKELNKLLMGENARIVLYDLEGKPISEAKNMHYLDLSVFENVKTKKQEVFIENVQNEEVYYHLCNYWYKGGKPIGFIDVYEKSDESSVLMNFKIMVKQYFFAMMIMLVLSGYVAWFISRALMKRIGILAKQLPKTNIEYLDTPIVEYKENDEISPLIESYNHMLRKLKQQTERVAHIEREESWREMAKQIVHEINNPLTPLKLSVQNFQRKYNPHDENNVEKVNRLVENVLHQIEVIHSITRSFSDYSQTPLGDNVVDVVKILRYSLDIFPEKIVEFHTDEQELFYKIDETYLTRVITNIVKNGIQSIPNEEKKIVVKLENEPNKFRISIQDNGAGISKENQDKIFERKFTTKSSGMGIGLSIVKKIVEDYNGKIWFDTEEGKGTIFYVEFYK